MNGIYSYFAVLIGILVVDCYYYETTYLDRFCQNGTFNLDTSLQRAGSLEFPVVSWQNCSVLISASARNFAFPNNIEVAIYLNIRKLKLSRSNGVKIYEITENGEELLKSISGMTLACHPFRQSCDQVLTQYGREPKLRLEFIRDGPSSQYIQLDWTIVSKDSSESSCGALVGYIPTELKCENYDRNRTNCPASYYGGSIYPDIAIENDHYLISDQKCRRWYPAIVTSGSSASDSGFGLTVTVVSVGFNLLNYG